MDKNFKIYFDKGLNICFKDVKVVRKILLLVCFGGVFFVMMLICVCCVIILINMI